MRPLHEAHAGSVPHLPASYLHLSMSLVTCLIAGMENSSDQAGIVDSADNILSIMITYWEIGHGSLGLIVRDIHLPTIKCERNQIQPLGPL